MHLEEALLGVRRQQLLHIANLKLVLFRALLLGDCIDELRQPSLGVAG
jgi:hypothetical protein